MKVILFKHSSFACFFILLANSIWFLQGCQTSIPLTEQNPPSIIYNWQRKNFHPNIQIIDRQSDSVTYGFTLPSQDFMPGNKSELVVKISLKNNNQWIEVERKFVIPEFSTESGYYFGQMKAPTSISCSEARILFKEENTIRQEEFQLDFKPYPYGPVWQNGLQNKILDFQEPIVFKGLTSVEWAIRTEKLPSPPFSTNPPSIPNEIKKIEIDSLGIPKEKLIANGSFVLRNSQGQEMLHLYENTTSQTFPKILFQNDLIGPMRYLCSKDEFEKIQRSNEGAENQLEKFWITCGGDKEKARELIQLYYRRVEDANIFFTSYADGWKTDRGMVYLVFGHPYNVSEDDKKLTWYYGAISDPATLKFEFLKTANPAWGMVYVLQRKENYRSAWEYQVTQWRQGKIFD